MSKKVFIKTLLTTSTVGVLGGGVAASLVGCSTNGTKALIINYITSTTGEVGVELDITCIHREIGFKERNLEILGDKFTNLTFNEDGTFQVTLPANTDAGTYDLRVYDSISGVESNPIPVTLFDKNYGTKVLTIGASNTIGTVGTALPIVVTYSGFNYDVTEHSFELYGNDATYFSLSAGSVSGTLDVVLSDSATEARAYNLQIRDITDDTVVPSNIVPITLNAPVVENLAIEVTTSYTGGVGEELDVAGTWKASNFDVTDATNIHLVSGSIFNEFSANADGTFTAELPASAPAGENVLQIQYEENFSNVIIITLINLAEQALSVSAANTVGTTDTDLLISGTFNFYNFTSAYGFSNLELTGQDAASFTDFSASETNGFTIKINTATAGVYKLQLKVKDSDILANVVNISISNPTISPLVLIISTSNMYHYTGTAFTIDTQYTAYNFTPDASNLDLDDSSSVAFSRISADTSKITVELAATVENGTYHFAIKDNSTNIVSNTISVVLLEKNDSTTYITVENSDNSIIATNQEMSVICVARIAGITANNVILGKDVNDQVFTNFAISIYGGVGFVTFTIPRTTAAGSYVFYLQDKGDDTFVSNNIVFTIGDFGWSNGSNWAGNNNVNNSTIVVTRDDNSHKATIVSSVSYSATNLVFPSIISDNGTHFSTINAIGANAFSTSASNPSTLNGTIALPTSLEEIGANAFSGQPISGTLSLDAEILHINENAFANCNSITTLNLTNFRDLPVWQATNIFTGWAESGLITATGGSLEENAALLTYLRARGLPTGWNFTTPIYP